MMSQTVPRSAARQHRGYASHLRAFCQQQHLLGFTVPLSEVLVEPRFLHQTPLMAPAEENLTKSALFGVPLIHAYPALHAAYHLPTHSLEEIGLGDPHVAILGVHGSGLTTALQALALFSMGVVQFPIPTDVIQEQLNAEEKKLKPEDRADRVRQNVLRAQQTRESLTLSQGKQYIDLMTGEDTTAPRHTLRTLAPMLVHLADVVLDSVEYGSVTDPAEPFVRALQSQVSYVTAQTMPPTLYQLLERGQALVLIDGLEDVPATERSAKLGWIKAFLEQYGSNRIVITAQPAGASELRAIGFSTTHLRPWDEATYEQFSGKVSQHAARVSVLNGDDRTRWLKRARRSVTRDGILGLLYPASAHPGEAVLAHLRVLLADFDERYEELCRLALMQLEQHAIRIDRLIESNAAVPAAEGDEAKTREKLRLQAVRQQRTALETLVKLQILVKIRGGHYRFVNKAYLAALVAPTVTLEQLTAQRHNPDWEAVITAANGFLNLETLVTDSLSQPPYADLRQILRPIQWLPYADGANWRVPYMRLLATLLIAPNQYTTTRETIAAALIMSQDESVVNVFRKLLQHENADCRRIGALALGALKDSEAAQTLTQQMNTDSESYVQVAAALALAGLRTEAATRQLIIALNQHPNSDVQRTAAESLAAFPTEGYPALFAAIRSTEMRVRRAAVWGVGRLRNDWALIALNEVFLEDEEVFVKLAVQQVYLDSYEEGSLGIHAYPAVQNIEWLQTWASKAIRANIIPNVREDIPLLLAAVQQKQDMETRLRCIVLVGQLGFLWASDRLYKALYDPQEAIRDSAHRSLCELGYGWNMRLPAPI